MTGNIEWMNLLSVQGRGADRSEDHPQRREVPRFSEAWDQRTTDNQWAGSERRKVGFVI